MTVHTITLEQQGTIGRCPHCKELVPSPMTISACPVCRKPVSWFCGVKSDYPELSD